MYRIEEKTYETLRQIIDAGRDSVVVPVGALENHSSHLPIGTDAMVAEILATEIAERSAYFLAPTIKFGVRLARRRGESIGIGAELFASLASEIFMDLNHMGFKRIIIINGHGGNTKPLLEIMKDLNRSEDVTFTLLNHWEIGEEILRRIYRVGPGHGGQDEVSVLLANNPEIVGRKEPKDFNVGVSGVYEIPYPAGRFVMSPEDVELDFAIGNAKCYYRELVDVMMELI